MRCRQARRFLSRRLDGLLSQTERETLDAHLAGCAACRARASMWASLGVELDRVAAPDPSPGFTRNVLERIAARRPSRAWTWRGGWEWLRPAPLGLGAAAFALGVTLAVLANGASRPSDSNGDGASSVWMEEYLDVIEEVSLEDELAAVWPDVEN